MTGIATDSFLRSVLETSTLTQEQCMSLLDYAETHPSSGTSAVAASLPAEEEKVRLEISRRQKLLFTYLAQLRGLNRDAILRVRQTKQATAEARQEIDRLHLQLQNLYYEQKHLMGEIAACESYEYVDRCQGRRGLGLGS